MAEAMTGCLRSDIELVSGERPMLFDPQSDHYYHLSNELLEITGFLTESRPVPDFLHLMQQQGCAIELPELVRLLAFLRRNRLLAPEYGEIGVVRQQNHEAKARSRFLRFSAAYLFFRLPPWRPERCFAKIAPYAGLLVSKWVVYCLLIPALLGYILLVRNWGVVQTTFADSLSWVGLAKYFAAILVMKILHETAHSLAAMHFNCRVRGIGIGFMVFYPRLYTDTTDSWRLPRRQRLLIDGAGIMAELLFGGVAALLWCYVPPGAWHSTLFYIFAVSTISTLLINGNPCIRYDGYYILCDLLNIDNLMTRSSEYVKMVWRHYLLKLGPRPQEERGWLLFGFGVASFVYKLFLYTAIILVIYHKFVKAVALVMLFMELYSILLYPFYRELKTIRALSKRSASFARWYLALGTLAIVAAVLFVPWCWQVDLSGEVNNSDRRWLMVPESGYLAQDFLRRPRPVKQGEPMVSLVSPKLQFEYQKQQTVSRFDLTKYRLDELDLDNFAISLVSGAKVASNQNRLAELERRQHTLTLHAPVAGMLVPTAIDLYQNAYLPRGATLGVLISGEAVIYAYATDREVGKLRVGDQVTVGVPDRLAWTYGKITQINLNAEKLLDSPLLQSYGGPIAVYAPTAGENTFSSVLPLYRVTVEVTGGATLDYGRTVSVKVQHQSQLYRELWQFLLGVLRREF